MGNEALCTLHYGGKSFSGRALLETSEMLFRGDTRLRIPFSSISKVDAKNGALHIQTKDALATFELGAKAEKWREKIANPKSRIDKLGVRPGDHVSVRGKFSMDFLRELKTKDAVVLLNGLAKDVAWVFLEVEVVRDLAQVKATAKTLQGDAALSGSCTPRDKKSSARTTCDRPDWRPALPTSR